ncbi:MAG: methylmalonyl Co-A mutase-associated GTPase MeaB [Cytophagales bacterium]
MKASHNKPSLALLERNIRLGSTVALGQGITLVESMREEDRELAQQLLNALVPFTGNATRIGITGVPGVGKSTFIEAFGKHLTAQGKKIAVLAIDPSSGKTKGSILGDKTRMEELAKDPLAFIRPTAAGAALGGVAYRTREAMLLCEAAGFDVVLIETVGVGQSETAARNLVDYFLLLMLAGAGDELQGIKKGIIEMADGLVITKADGDNQKKAAQAQADFQYAMHLFSPPASGVKTKVLTCSALTNQGIAEVWQTIEQFVETTRQNGFFELNRSEQNVGWFQELFEQRWRQQLFKRQGVSQLKQNLEIQIKAKKISPSEAVNYLFAAMSKS